MLRTLRMTFREVLIIDIMVAEVATIIRDNFSASNVAKFTLDCPGQGRNTKVTCEDEFLERGIIIMPTNEFGLE